MPTTGVTQLRLLINDQTSTEFTDSQLQTFLDTAGYTGEGDPIDSAIFLAASIATNALVVKYGSVQIQEVSLGGFQASQGRSQVKYLQQQADRFYQLYIDTPAFAIAEENLSGFNELEIIRNWVLRNEI
jgi:hypothetical protein